MMPSFADGSGGILSPFTNKPKPFSPVPLGQGGNIYTPTFSGGGGNSGGGGFGGNIISDGRTPPGGSSLPFDPITIFAFGPGKNTKPIPVPPNGQCPAGTTYGPNPSIIGGGGGLCYAPGTQSTYALAVETGYNLIAQGINPNQFFTNIRLNNYLCKLGYKERCGLGGQTYMPGSSPGSPGSTGTTKPTKNPPVPPISADPLLPGLPSGNTGVVPPVINITPGGTTTGGTTPNATDPIYSVLANLFPAGGSNSPSAPTSGQSFLFADYGGGVVEGGSSGGGSSMFMILLLVGLGVAGYFAYQKWG